MNDNEQLVDGLRDSIAMGRYVPGQWLVEADLAHEHQATRFQVRNALSQLAVDGLVVRIVNRGARVREISLAESIQLLDVRCRLDVLVAGEAAARVRSDSLPELAEMERMLVHAAKAMDARQYRQQSECLWSLVRKTAQNPPASRVIAHLDRQLARRLNELTLSMGIIPEVLRHEHALLDAIAARDVSRAERAAFEHATSLRAALTMSSQQNTRHRIAQRFI